MESTIANRCERCTKMLEPNSLRMKLISVLYTSRCDSRNDDSGMMRMASAVYQPVVLQTSLVMWLGVGRSLGLGMGRGMGYRAWVEGVNMGDGVHHPAVAHTYYIYDLLYTSRFCLCIYIYVLIIYWVFAANTTPLNA